MTTYYEEFSPLMEEYRSLRQEILDRQRDSIYVVGFNLVAMAGIFAAGANAMLAASATTRLMGVMGATLGSFAVVIASVLITTSLSKHVDGLAKYITVFIENRVGELNWNSARSRLNELGRLGRLSLVRFSDALAGVYSFIALAAWGISTMLMLALGKPILVLIPTLLLAAALYYVGDLYFHFSEGWSREREWENIREMLRAKFLQTRTKV